MFRAGTIIHTPMIERANTVEFADTMLVESGQFLTFP